MSGASWNLLTNGDEVQRWRWSIPRISVVNWLCGVCWGWTFLVQISTCGRCRVDLISGSHYPCHVECVLYYVVCFTVCGVEWSFVLSGASIMFWPGCLPGFSRNRTWVLVWFCALSCCMLLYDVCSLCTCTVCLYSLCIYNYKLMYTYTCNIQ